MFMAIPKEQLFQEALHLDEESRAALTGVLIESLDMETEEGVEAAWLEEIERRMDSLDAGEVKTVSWDEVKERLYKNMNA
jgi:putative addiction module component (TIGR02574 family)